MATKTHAWCCYDGVLNWPNYAKCCGLLRRRTSKPLLQSQVCKANVKIRLLKCSPVKPGSTICSPVFGPSQKANRSKALEALTVRGQGPGFMPCGQTCQQPLHEEPGFQACQRDKAGSNSKTQLRCSFLKALLLVWKVDVAELLFENANCSCLKPPIADSFLLSGSKEENILSAPFKSCWRPCKSSFQCPRSGPDLLQEC